MLKQFRLQLISALIFLFTCSFVFANTPPDAGMPQTNPNTASMNMPSIDTSEAHKRKRKLKEARAVKAEVEKVLGHRGPGVFGYRDFFYPKYHGLRLSYCTPDKKSCGLDVASNYCALLGYDKAEKIMMDHNVGLTRYLGTNLQCKGWRCDAFKLITCKESLVQKPTPVYYYRMRDFMLPRFENYRVDWCYEDKKGCGRRAANAFCRQLGYARSKGYEKSTTIAATRTIGSGALCFGPNCNGFERITCYR